MFTTTYLTRPRKHRSSPRYSLSYPWKDVEEEEKSIFEGKRELEGGWRRATRF